MKLKKRVTKSNLEIDEIQQIESNFEEKRVIRKRRMTDYESSDQPIVEIERKFTIDIYNRVLDTIIGSMEKRFSNNNELLVDLSLLSPTNFNSFKNGLPSDSLNKLT